MIAVVSKESQQLWKAQFGNRMPKQSGISPTLCLQTPL